MARVGDRGRWSPLLAVVLATALLPSAAAGRPPSPEERPRIAVPQVPYLQQTAALCGGAALAMVLRYWGAAGVRPEDFSAALLPSGEGITTGTLASLAEERGYQALAFRGDPGEAAGQLGKGRPLIALAGRGSGPTGRHYVVLLAWANARVLLHDPADGPFRVLPESEWLERWTAADRWALVVLPPAGRRPGPEPAPDEHAADAAPAPSDDPCADRVAAAVEHAEDLESARRELVSAAEQCPGSSAPVRELAGFEFRRENWAGASSLAEEAVRRRADDALSWRILATSRFLEGRPQDALVAWNEVGEPKLDLVTIDGLERTPFRAVYDSLGTGPEQLLTPSLLRRAQRRLAALPAAEDSRVSYGPLPQGRARLEAVIVERPTLDPLPPLLVESALRAVTDRQVGMSLANVTRTGDRARLLWQWQPNRPRVALSASAPRALGLPGIVTVEALWDEQAYRVPATRGKEVLLRERRRRASVGVEDWWRADTRTGASVAVDEWADRGRSFSLAASVDRRLGGDRVSLAASVAGWAGPSGPPFHAHALRLSTRSRATEGRRPVLRLDVSYEGASRHAPLALWSGAGTGLGRDPLLRAHRLVDDGVVAGPCFGRHVVRAGVEGQAGVTSLGPLRIEAALFVDAARVLAPTTGSASPVGFVDLGAGLRVRLPGGRSTLRVDVATPWGRLRPQLSAGWVRAWPD